MIVLVLGLVVFFAVHSVRIYGDDWRTAQIARRGADRWKALYALASALGLALVVWGFGLARAQPVALWNPPSWTQLATTLLTLPAFVLLAAAYVPGNRIKARVGHPMVAGVALWAFAHLLGNGRLDGTLLFGSFLCWAVLDYRAAVRRDRLAGVSYPAGAPARDAVAVAVGGIAWALFAVYLHARLIGRAVLPG